MRRRCSSTKASYRLALLVSGLAAVFTVPASARCQMENKAEMHIAAGRNQLLTEGVIDSHAVRVLIDTGSNTSMIWRPAIERLGLHAFTGPRMRLYGLGGESTVYAAVVKEFRVANFTARNQRFLVAGDLQSGMDFILAEDFLSRFSVEFDLRHWAVRTMNPTGCTIAELPYWATTYSMADLAASPHDAQAIQVDVLLNGHRVRAQIDSGSTLSILSKSVADGLGVHYTGTPDALVGIGRGSLQTWLADVGTFTLGDETITNTQLRVAQTGKYRTTVPIGSRIPVEAPGKADMLLGLDFLRAHRVLIDNSTRKMVFTYEGGPVFETTAPSESNGASPAEVGRALR
jgi:predicted aspartyl protease